MIDKMTIKKKNWRIGYDTLLKILVEGIKALAQDVRGFALLGKKAPMKIIIVGRSGSGKDTLACELQESFGYSQLLSTTTRPRRTPTENTHVFVTQAQANEMTERVAETIINGYEYFATRGQLEENDIYVIDPIGLKSLCENAPDVPLYVVYVEATQATRLRRAKSRAADPDEAEEIFYSRQADEDTQFSAFESLLKNREAFQKAYPSARALRILSNDNDDRSNIQAFAQMVDWEISR